jgi:hypothetical protein
MGRVSFLLIVVCLLIGLGIISHAQEQGAKLPLTTADVIKMVKAGLPESTIVLAINQSPAQFDVSPDSLIRLKAAGVSPKILEAMLLASSGKQPVPSATTSLSPPSITGIPSVPVASGVYYQKDKEWIKLEEAPKPELKSRGMKKMILTTGFLGGDAAEVYRGRTAPIQIPESKPVFYIKGISSTGRDIQLVRLEQKEASREIQNTSGTLFNKRTGYRKGDIREVTVTKGDDHVLVAPTAALSAGEYLLVFDNGEHYDFGITKE